MSKSDDTLIRKRASYKGQLTTFVSYLENLPKELDEDATSQLQLRVGKIKDLYEKYDDVQMQIECECESKNITLQYTEREEFESLYFTVLSKSQNILAKNIKVAPSRSNAGRLIKLPPIPVPSFSGNYSNWLEFRDTFISLVHSNDDIDDITKFHHLRAALKESASLVIQSLEVSAANYPVAWKLICERYDNTRLLIQNHIANIFNIETIQRESSMNLKRIIDQFNKNLRSLETLGEPTKHWDTLLIYILQNKLDAKTYREWEEVRSQYDANKTIDLKTLMLFLRNRSDLLETLENSKTHTHSQQPTKPNNTKHKTMVSVSQEQQKDSIPATRTGASPSKPCPKCTGLHNLSACPQFLALSNEERLQLLPSYKVCYNCFKQGHYSNHCKKPGCKACKRKHNTIIHTIRPQGSDNTGASESVVRAGDPAGASSSTNSTSTGTVLSALAAPSAAPSISDNENHNVLLSTALITVCDTNQQPHIARVLLDSGSTSCLITEELVKRLNLPCRSFNKSILGINNSLSNVTQRAMVDIKSLNEQFSTSILCFVLPAITDNIPFCHIDVSKLQIPTNLNLADPNFYSPSSIDMLLGADLFWDLLGTQKVKLGVGEPILYDTKLGWVISGPVGGSSSSPIQCNFTCVSHCNELSNDVIQNQLTRFWQLEEVDIKPSYYSDEEKLCEEHFVKNTTRLPDGRFCVKLPLKQSAEVLGDSFNRAKKCLLSLESRLKKQPPSYNKLYCEFMSEYLVLGHMSKVNLNSQTGYFIPHHGVLRESSSTTKLRVVFNASSPTTSGVSLNQIQMVGPVIQDDLLSILIRFRLYRYVLTSDIEKMYRTVMVHPDDRYLQQIIWRGDSDTYTTYQLNTVTYGMASAPFLAIRCLKQIGLDCEETKIGDVIGHDFYVDDLLTGGDTIEEVADIRHKVTSALASAGMHLRKWKSNERSLLVHDSSPSISVDLNIDSIGDNNSSKTLGLGWHPDSDELWYSVNIDAPKSTNLTKRNILSIISSIFDPLGLLGPCIISMKMLLQSLWVLQLSWDDNLPTDIEQTWAKIVADLPTINCLRIPRYTLCESQQRRIDLHIFADASQSAYGACVYVRSVNEYDEVCVRLLIAKSRVAPLKPTTIPRLELCAALVGSRLYKKLVESLRCQIRETTFWTDSTIVLGWLKVKDPSRLQPFVRNRVTDITDITAACTWRHVPTDQNPADLISRGVNIDTMKELDLWWSGPGFLLQECSKWPTIPGDKKDLPEIILTANVTEKPLIDFTRFSNLLRLIRSVAYVLRFISYCKKETKPPHLATDELEKALIIIVKQSQMESFPEEYKLLRLNKKLNPKNQLLKYNVFLDNNQLIRVGGRLDNADFDYNKKHPLLLQSTNHFTEILFRHEHKELSHAGPQLLLASIKDRYWPLRGRYLAKKCYYQCVRCARLRGETMKTLMGNLPCDRLQPGLFPFENCGVDYAGPILSASRQGRSCRLMKVYIAVFVCFNTKAIHLELVGDLSSTTFLSALKRFMSRRGKPRNLYSDNGTSFVGACNEISKFLDSNCNLLAESAANIGINFHFSPAYAPHFGGLWEAGVRSCKFHLYRVVGNCKLTYEELYTVLVQIEAVLNSRPLTPLSTDPADLQPLTPGHFLIGRPLTSLPTANYEGRPYNYLKRHQRIEQLRQHFWARWSKEYVSELQQRVKWRTNSESVKMNTLVLLKEDNLPPLKWKLGRIVAVYPGKDHISRVADIKTSSGLLRRAFTKICPLPESG